MTRSSRCAFLPLLLLAGCVAAPGQQPASLYPLASFTEYKVTVEIALEMDENGLPWLAATFTPEEGYHLYSKDIPPEGVEGLGRPTFLELLPGSNLEPAGELTESVAARPDEDIEGLLVYPEGPVTLRLPVNLPEGQGWFDEQVSVTFMACKTGACLPPVVDRLVPLRVPGAQEIQQP
jgi:hypothetical protein